MKIIDAQVHIWSQTVMPPSGLHRKVATAFAGNPECRIRPHQRTCLLRRHVILPDMRAVAASGTNQIGSIVQQERHLA